MMEDNERQSYNQEDQDDFGLPEVEYRPIEREDEISHEDEQSTYYQNEEEEESGKSKGPMVFGIITLLLIIGLVVYLFLFDGMAQVNSWFSDPEPVVKEEVVPEPEPIPEPEPEVEETAPVEEVDPLAPYSEISTISEPTGRSFIVVGSFVDEDLALDYANKMMEQGIGVKVLSPTDRAPLMHRVAVADYEDFNEAMQLVPQFREKYGDNSWVLKY